MNARNNENKRTLYLWSCEKWSSQGRAEEERGEQEWDKMIRGSSNEKRRERVGCTDLGELR